MKIGSDLMVPGIIYSFFHGLFHWFSTGVLNDILVLQLLANCAMSF